MKIETWINEVINGAGGFKSMEEHELAIHADRDVSIAAFVIRALANPECEGSNEVIEAIINQRRKRGAIIG